MKSFFRNLEGITILIFFKTECYWWHQKYCKIQSVGYRLKLLRKQDKNTLSANSVLFTGKEGVLNINVYFCVLNIIFKIPCWSWSSVLVARSRCFKIEYCHSRTSSARTVRDKKITGMNGSHFLYLYDDLIENDHFWKSEFKILKIWKFKNLIRVQFLILENWN